MNSQHKKTRLLFFFTFTILAYLPIVLLSGAPTRVHIVRAFIWFFTSNLGAICLWFLAGRRFLAKLLYSVYCVLAGVVDTWAMSQVIRKAEFDLPGIIAGAVFYAVAILFLATISDRAATRLLNHLSRRATTRKDAVDENGLLQNNNHVV